MALRLNYRPANLPAPLETVNRSDLDNRPESRGGQQRRRVDGLARWGVTGGQVGHGKRIFGGHGVRC